ncbi:TetR/AcrR family transcriptional regulator [Propionicimonas sp.]|uniref:TetR/AcrR family transcriptional regulator n=1 Tax=Propionicimonas sp. TaxID=1955623 RepID=UPI0039E31D4C
MPHPKGAWAPEWAGDRVQRRRLSTDAIVAAGLELLAAEGIDAVTMRAVAARLGTGPASLYAHVRDKQDLHELMLDAVFAEVHVPDPEPERWQEQLKEAIRSVYEALARHPGIAMVNMAHIPLGPNALRCSERLLRICLAGGLTEEMSGLCVDLLTLYPTAVAVEDAIWYERGKRSDWMNSEQAVIGRLGDYFGSLPGEVYPTIRAMAPFLLAGNGQDRFEFGLAVLIAGVDALKSWRPQPSSSDPERVVGRH